MVVWSYSVQPFGLVGTPAIIPTVSTTSFSIIEPIAPGAPIGVFQIRNDPTLILIFQGDPGSNFIITSLGGINYLLSASLLPPPAGTYSLVVEGANSAGAGFGTLTVVVAPTLTGYVSAWSDPRMNVRRHHLHLPPPPGSNVGLSAPVLTAPANATITDPLSPGVTVSTIGIANGPLSTITILSGDDNHSFAVLTNGALQTSRGDGTGGGTGPLPVDGVYIMRIQGTAAFGPSNIITVQVTVNAAATDTFAAVDGRQNAPTGATIPFPNQLRTYHPVGTLDNRYFLGTGGGYQPPWHTAGIDYAVGPHAAVSLKDPNTMSIASVVVDTVGHHITVNAAGITIDGWDFSINNGWDVTVAANNVTLQNCSFTSTAVSPGLIVTNTGVTGLTVQYCTFNNNGGAASNTTALNFQGTSITVQYCWFRLLGKNAINLGSGGTYTGVIKYNLFHDVGQAVTNSKWLTLFSGTATLTVSFNTAIMDNVGVLPEFGFLFEPDVPATLQTIDFSNNTMLAIGAAANLSYFCGIDPTFTTAGTTQTVNNNYVDPTRVTGFIRPATQTGSTTFSQNINMLTGALIVPNVTGATPTVNAAGPFTFFDPIGANTPIQQLSATNGPITNWAITSADVTHFSVGSASGLLQFTAVNPPDATYTVSVAATNQFGQGPSTNISVTVAPLSIAHGQLITAANVGRAGAQAAGVAGFSTTTTTINTAQVFSTSQTINNTIFSNAVLVTTGNVVFNFCQFTFQPPSAAHALQIYNNGSAAGTVTCNWCDIDSGLRTTAGNFETCAFQAGERGSIGTNNPTFTGSFLLYRTSMQGYGNGAGLHKWQGQVSTLRECYIANLTSGGGSHGDGVEIYTSDNITIERCRIQVISNGTAQSCIQPANQDFGDTVNSNPIIVQQNYFDGGIGPVSVFLGGAPAGSGTHVRNVRLIGNYFGDNNQYGAVYDLLGNGVGLEPDVTYDLPFFTANQATSTNGLIYMALDNLWAPNGENVNDPATTPSGDQPQGKPHVAGQFVGVHMAAALGISPQTWTGTLRGPGTPPVVTTPIILTVGPSLSAGLSVGQCFASNSPTRWRMVANSTITDIAGRRYITIDDTGVITVTALGATSLTPATYSVTVQAINSSGPGSATAQITVAGAGNAPVITQPSPFTLTNANNGVDAAVEVISFTGGTPNSWSISQASDPNDNFAIYTRGDGTGSLRTSDGTTAGGGGGPPPPAATYNLSITASNSFGSNTKPVQVIVQGATAVPIINPQTFTLSLNAAGVGAPAGTPVGTATAQNGPITSFQFATGGNPNNWFAMTTGGAITVSAAGSSTTTGIQAGTQSLSITATNAVGTSAAGTITVLSSVTVTTGFADQTNTGYTNEPGFNTSANPTPGQLTAMSQGSIVAGQTYRYKFFDAGSGGTQVSVQNVTFIGCQFASNSQQNYNLRIAANGGTTTFHYCTISPRPSLVTQPPGGFIWPSRGGPQGGGSGGDQDPNRQSVQILASQGFGYGIQTTDPGVTAAGHVLFDRCDLWGFGNASDLHVLGTQYKLVCTNFWVHDSRNDSLGDHTDGLPGDLAGNNGQMNDVIMINNTVAAIGNTQAVALQGPGPYQNLVIKNCYLSGFGTNTAITNTLPGNKNQFFVDNTYGTDVQWDISLCNIIDKTNFGFGGSSATAGSHRWKRNRLHVKPGTSRNANDATGWNASNDGQFVWLDSAGTFHNTDFTDVYSSSNPVITPQNFSVSRAALTSGFVIGTLASSNAPTSWSIIAASPPYANPLYPTAWLAISNGGTITVTASGVSAIPVGSIDLWIVAIASNGNWSEPAKCTVTIT